MSFEDEYRKGYDRGKQDNILQTTGAAFLGMLQADPGGFYAEGYKDGASGKPFRPHGNRTNKKAQTRTASASPSLTNLERQWFRLCDECDFIPAETVQHFSAALRAEGNLAAVVVGLSKFVDHTCPKCSASGQFKIHFLGELKHKDCGWTGYMGTGSYIGYQVSQILHIGIRAGGSLKDDSDRKGEKGAGWFNGILAFIFVGIFRAFLACVLIPLHGIVSIAHPDQTTSERVRRGVILSVALALIGVGGYEIRRSELSRVGQTPSYQSLPISASPPVSNSGPAVDDMIYVNRRFGFTVGYPSNFHPQGVSGNGDGQEFVSLDGTASLRAWGEENLQRQTLADHLRDSVSALGINVTYQRLKRDFYVVSGYAGGKIVYLRVTLRKDTFWAFLLSYNRNASRNYDALPARITKSYVIPK